MRIWIIFSSLIISIFSLTRLTRLINIWMTILNIFQDFIIFIFNAIICVMFLRRIIESMRIILMKYNMDSGKKLCIVSLVIMTHMKTVKSIIFYIIINVWIQALFIKVWFKLMS